MTYMRHFGVQVAVYCMYVPIPGRVRGDILYTCMYIRMYDIYIFIFLGGVIKGGVAGPARGGESKQTNLHLHLFCICIETKRQYELKESPEYLQKMR
jgi:hypothetical protein